MGASYPAVIAELRLRPGMTCGSEYFMTQQVPRQLLTTAKVDFRNRHCGELRRCRSREIQNRVHSCGPPH
jgi:hypothetical protein